MAPEKEKDKLGFHWTSCLQLYSVWRSCVRLQCNIPATTAGVLSATDLLSRPLDVLEAAQPKSDGEKMSTIPATYSLFQNFRALFKYHMVAHCENSIANVDREDKSSERLQYRAKDEETHEAVEKYIAMETTKDRFRLVFDTHDNEFMRLSPELQLFGQGMLCGTGLAMTGGLLRGCVRGRATALKGTAETAHISLGHMVTGMLKAGLKDCLWTGAKMAPLIALALGVSQSIAIHRGKSTPFECSAGITIAFGVGNAHRGPKGIVAGLLVGYLISLLLSPMMWGILLTTDQAQEQLHYKVIEMRIKNTQ